MSGAWIYLGPLIAFYVLTCAGIMFLMRRAEVAHRVAEPARARSVAKRRPRLD